jgi:signal peptidase I
VINGCSNAPAVPDTCIVPESMVFVLGDNRVSSQDSRFFGPIDEDTIVGRAFLKVWPVGDIAFL